MGARKLKAASLLSSDNKALPKSRHDSFIIDDDPTMAETLQSIVGGNTEVITSDFEKEIANRQDLRPDTIFLDVNLGINEKINGLDLVPLLLKLFPDSAIFVMTSLSDDQTIERALSLGVDDFLRKPLWPAEVRARLIASLEVRSDETRIAFRDLTLFYRDRRIKGPKASVQLGSKEFRVLELLMKCKGGAMTRTQLKYQIWAGKSTGANSVDQLITRVRKALIEVGSRCTIMAQYGGQVCLARKESIPSTSSEPNRNASFDASCLLELAKETGDAELPLRLVDLFINKSRDPASQMIALSTKEFESSNPSIQRLAHKLKGMCRQVGAISLAELCQIIEFNTSQVKLPKLIESFSKEYDIIFTTITKFGQTLK